MVTRDGAHSLANRTAPTFVDQGNVGRRVARRRANSVAGQRRPPWVGSPALPQRRPAPVERRELATAGQEDARGRGALTRVSVRGGKAPLTVRALTLENAGTRLTPCVAVALATWRPATIDLRGPIAVLDRPEGAGERGALATCEPPRRTAPHSRVAVASAHRTWRPATDRAAGGGDRSRANSR